MSAYKEFKKVYNIKHIAKHYWLKIFYKNSVGLDRVSNNHFADNLSTEIEIIYRKVNKGTYRFTNYKELLISKGANKNPRIISIPTIRDQLVLSLCNELLKKVFCSIEFPLVQEVVDCISKEIVEEKYNAYVKLDISHFYPSIDHFLLNQKLGKKIRKTELLNLINGAITTPTMPITVSSKNLKYRERGVPEGVAISNILANIYLDDLSKELTQKFDIAFFRYVDDILILCDYSQAHEIMEFLISLLKSKYKLDANTEKTVCNYLREGVTYLGYEFYNDRISVCQKAVSRIENSLDDLFRNSKKYKSNINLFIWKLNLKITGCVFDKKKYGWLFFYSQLTDISILYHLDWLIKKLCIRYNIPHSNVKKYVRAYHEIRNNQHESKYLINADNYDNLDKRRILANIYKVPIDDLKRSEDEIEKRFRRMLFRDLSSLEKDIQNFS